MDQIDSNLFREILENIPKWSDWLNLRLVCKLWDQIIINPDIHRSHWSSLDIKLSPEAIRKLEIVPDVSLPVWMAKQKYLKASLDMVREKQADMWPPPNCYLLVGYTYKYHYYGKKLNREFFSIIVRCETDLTPISCYDSDTNCSLSDNTSISIWPSVKSSEFISCDTVNWHFAECYTLKYSANYVSYAATFMYQRCIDFYYLKLPDNIKDTNCLPDLGLPVIETIDQLMCY